MTDDTNGETKYYVELPADEYGNTSMHPVVIEARSEFRGGREMLFPVAPESAMGWSSGFYRDFFGGWAETDGPARELTREEYINLIASIPQATKDATPTNMVTLKNGETMPRDGVNILMMLLKEVFEQYPIQFCELVEACRDHNHVTFGNTHEVLEERALIESRDSDGRVRIHDLTRSIVLSAVEGEGLEMRLVNPIAD